MDTGIFIGDKIITTSWDKIWNKPTTLSGYGITDAVTIDTHQQIYGTKEFRQTVFIDTQSDVKLIMRDDDNHALIGAANSKGSVLSRLGYYGDRWGIDGYKMLTTNNYSAELDNRYVNKAGDTMTGKLLFNADSGIDLMSIPRTKSAISFNNAGSNRIGINFTDGDGNLRIARTDINQDWVSGDVNILLGSNNYKVWHAGNDGSGSGLDADLLDGYHESNFVRSWWTDSPGYDCSTYNNRPLISFTYGNSAPFSGGFIDVNTSGYGFYLGTGHSSDQSLYYRRHGSLLDGGMGSWQQLARVTDNIASATKLQTPRTIFSKPFDGTGNVTGGAKFTNICIDTDNNGNDIGRGSEINNYNDPLCLQHDSSKNLICCVGGGNVGIGTTNAAHKLHVEGDIYATNGFSETSDIRKKKVLSPHTVDLDDMAYADLFDYTLIDDEKEIVRVGTNAHYWLDKLPQVVTKDNDEYLSLNYGVLGTVCALSVSKYVK
jgi:hypothetical protein